jgi:pilus assembly protein CpaB
MKAHFYPARNFRDEQLKRIVLSLLFLSTVILAASGAVVLTSSKGEVSKTQAASAEILRSVDQTEVIVPVVAIEARTQLSPSMFRSISLPSTVVPEGALSRVGDVTDYYAKTRLVPNYPVLRETLMGADFKSKLPLAIPTGYRAVTIDVTKRTSVEGWVQPGNRVDVLWLTQMQNRPALVPIVQNAEIFSAEQRTEKSDRPGLPTTVTLLVTSRDANIITFALTSGTLSLSLRGEGDDLKSGDVTPVFADMLLPGKPVDFERETRYAGRATLNGTKYRVKENGELLPEE